MMLLGFSSSTGGEAAFSNSIAHDSTLYGSDSTSAGIVALASGTGNITGRFLSNKFMRREIINFIFALSASIFS